LGEELLMADPRERHDDMDEALRFAMGRVTGEMWTALPVTVTEDSDGHICRLRPVIKGQQQAEDGSYTAANMPEMGMVPIVYSAGGGFTMTHPVKKGDEGIAIFSARCIDGWWKEGGIQPEPYARRYNLSDAMYIPGIRNKPRKLNPYVSKETIQLRTDDQHFYIEISKDKIKLIQASDKEGGQQETDIDATNPFATNEKEEKEKKTQPRMVVELTADKIRGYVLDQNGKETSYFEHTKEGQHNIKAPQGMRFETPSLTVTGKIIAGGEITAKGGVGASAAGVDADGVDTAGIDTIDEYAEGSVSMSTHRHPQGNDSRGDRQQDTGVPISGT
jgi:hypothetical protein